MPDQNAEVSYSAFGQPVTLDAGSDAFQRDDSLWRVREIYDRVLGAQVLPSSGCAIDIGAGFGAFAIPFALARPEWSVICFEPDSDIFALLSANITRYELSARVTAIQAAVAPVDGVEPGALKGIHDAAALAASALPASFRQKLDMPSFISSGDDARWRGGTIDVTHPTLPPEAVAALSPDLVKFVCPGNEHTLLKALAGTPTTVIVGECWTPPPTATVFGPDAPDATVYVPLAGTPLRLQRAPAAEGKRHGLDVVVAMYNTRDYILECVQGIIAAGAQDVRALVVDDGSNDGCGALVTQEFGNDPRVRLITKPNGGCASARNYGRMLSDATHIAFVDADDVPDSGLFPGLLELSRYSGAEVTQGAFDMLYDEPGGIRHVPSPEGADFADTARTPFGASEYFTLPWQTIVTGQPTIWRRVYRRDFLDAKTIWFPEHIRAFDDQIFQMLSAHYAGTIYARDDVAYHYRQHTGQDIRQGDERMIYSLEMYRMLLRRAVAEGWSQFAPFVDSFFNTLDWISNGIRADLKDGFLRGAAELWVYMQKVFGTDALAAFDRSDTLDSVFGRTAAELTQRLAPFGNSYVWAYLDAPNMHPDMVRAMRAAKEA